MLSSAQVSTTTDASRDRRRQRRLSLLAGAVAAAAVALSAAPALAVTTANLYAVPTGGATAGNYPAVCTQADPCTLGWALHQTNSTTNVNGDAAVINLAAGTYADSNYTIQATGGTPASVEFQGEGSGPSSTVLDGGGATRVINVNGVGYPVTLANLTLQNGNSSGDGGNLLADTTGSGSVTLSDDIVTGGYSGPGGQADVTAGTLNVDDTTVEDSGSDTWGSDAVGGTLNVDDSTYVANSNSAVSAINAAIVDVTSSTLAGNADYGLDDDSTGAVDVALSTLSGNGSGGIATESGPTEDAELLYDILASNAGHDCLRDGSHPTDGGDNVLDDSTCAFGSSLGSKVVTTAAIGLLPLANNGGATQTERITATSAAYDIVLNSLFGPCEIPGTDQRGMPTDSGAYCDAGAYQVAPPTITGISTSNVEPGTSVTLTGTNLVYTTSATFGAGNVAGTIDSQSLTSLTVTVPALSVGSEPVTVTNADGTASFAFIAFGPTITTTSLPAAGVDQQYSEQLATSGGTPPLSWSISAGALPKGFGLSSTGAILGSSSSAESGTATIEVKDADGASSTQALTLAVVVPSVTIDSSGVKLKGSKGSISLACNAAPCSGNAEIAQVVHTKVKKGHKTVEKTTTIVLASGSYRLATGANGIFTVKLTSIGRHDLASASTHHPLHETLLATLLGGSTAKRSAKIT
jgi:hypothetical protein